MRPISIVLAICIITMLFFSCKSNKGVASAADSLIGTFTSHRDSLPFTRITKDGDEYKVAFFKRYLSDNNLSNLEDITDPQPLEPATEHMIEKFFGQDGYRFVSEGWINRDLNFGIFKISKGVVFHPPFSESFRSNTGLFIACSADSTKDFPFDIKFEGDAIRVPSPGDNVSKLMFLDELPIIQDSLKLMEAFLNRLSASQYPEVEFLDTIHVDGVNYFSPSQRLSETDKKYQQYMFKNFSASESRHFFILASYLRRNFIDVAKKDSTMQAWQFIYKKIFHEKENHVSNFCGTRFILVDDGNKRNPLPEEFRVIDKYQSLRLIGYKPGADCYYSFL